MNVRAIRTQRLREELVCSTITEKVDVLGIKEHRMLHTEDIKYETVNGRTLITSSAWRNDSGAATGGVGILLISKSKKALSSVIKYNERIIIINLLGNPATAIILTYCPTNMSVGEVSEGHYDNLKRAIESVPVHNVLIFTEDFNAQIGREDVQYSYHEKTNRNGKMLLALAMKKHLEITNTRFRKRSGKQWTFLGPEGSKSQIDFILVSKKWRNSVKNVEPYNSFSIIGPDHRIVTAEIRLGFKKT